MTIDIGLPFAQRSEEVRVAVRYAWCRLKDALDLLDPDFLFSGPFPVVETLRDPLFRNPGVWLALGPYPDFPVLEVKASKENILSHLWSCLRPDGLGGFRWAWEERSDPPPTYVAALVMKEYWTFASALESALTSRFLPGRSMVEGLPCPRCQPKPKQNHLVS